jgi:hypothetical protein
MSRGRNKSAINAISPARPKETNSIIAKFGRKIASFYTPRVGLSASDRQASVLQECVMNLYYWRKFHEAEKLFHDVTRLLLQ